MSNYYHTDESAYQTIKNYQLLQEIESFNQALDSMHEDWDYLDHEDKSAYAHYMRNLMRAKKNGTR
jgi:hypothetical protein